MNSVENISVINVNYNDSFLYLVAMPLLIQVVRDKITK